MAHRKPEKNESCLMANIQGKERNPEIWGYPSPGNISRNIPPEKYQGIARCREGGALFGPLPMVFDAL